ncbi:MAG TPA: hypothetical protein VGH20_16555 [Myxococcales bacterium]
MLPISGRVLFAVFALSSFAVRAEGLDRDTLLTDAPAVPDKGTVRLTGALTGTSDTSGVDNTQGQANIVAGVQWAPIERFSADVSAYFQVGAQGPSARARYQILKQWDHGIDLSAGVRFKTVGFHPDQGEIEFLVAGGRRFGQFELILNGVFGAETGAGGKDAEVKGFAGYRFSPSLSAGIDGRLQAELGDDEVEALTTPNGVRDYDLTVGPAVSWMITRTIQLQALFGLAQPKKTNITAPLGALQASVDF